MNQPLGFQCYEIFPDLAQDWDGTWKKMAGFGYQFVDLLQFFGPVEGRTAQDARDALDANGLYCTNCHFSLTALTENLRETVAAARLLGLTSIVSFPSPRQQTADDWKWMADQLNVIGANLKQEGLFVGYHNHEIEFQEVEGEVPFDLLMSHTDPELVRFQIDVGNLAYAGKDPVAYMEKYGTRCFSLHAKDFAPGKESVPVGEGVLDWKRIFELAQQAGIDNYVAEVAAYTANTLAPGEPLEPNPLGIVESYRLSYQFLRGFNIEG